MKCFETGLKAAAKKLPISKKSFYRQTDPEYGQNLFRVSGVNDSKGFYSYVYRGNQSKFSSVEQFSLELNGYEFANG